MTEESGLTHYNASPFPDGRDPHGTHVDGPPTTTKIQVVTAPLSGEERLLLPEALRATETRQFITRAAVVVVDNDHGQVGDVLTYGGRRYRAVVVKAWGEGFFEAIGERIET